MKNTFIASLCHNGILGGALYIEDYTLTFRTNKLTVDEKYRNLVMPIDEIVDLRWKWIIFPIATFTMASGEEYTFIVFNKSGLMKALDEV